MAFDLITIIYLVIIALLLLIGIKRGLFKTLISLIKDILSFVLSLIFVKPLTLLFVNSNLGTKLTLKFETLLIEKNPLFETILTPSNKDKLIEMTLQQLNLPAKIVELFSKMLSNTINLESVNDLSIAAAIAPTITYYIFLVLSFILIFIVVRILARLLNKLFKSFEQIPLLKFVNRFFGGILGLVVGVLLVCMISYALTFIIPLDLPISNWFIENMKLNEETFTISKYLYNENILLIIISYIQGLLF